MILSSGIERERISAHLAHAEHVARAAPVSTLDRPQQLARELLLRELSAYRERGEFPENTEVPDARHPTFVDHRGVRCAMAHLLEHGGAAALVGRIARERNLAYVEELAELDGLVVWLSSAGLSVAEAAHIQPSYGFTAAACVCGEVNAFQLPGGYAPRSSDPVDAVLEVTYLAPAPQRAGAWRVRIEAIHGEAHGGAVGDEVLVDAAPAIQASAQPAAGVLALLDLGPGQELVAADLDAGLPVDTVLPYTLLTLGANEQSVHCLVMKEANVDVPSTTRAQLIDVRGQGSQCSSSLAASDARWGVVQSSESGSSGGGSCTSSGGASSSSSGSAPADAGSTSTSGSSGTRGGSAGLGGGCGVGADATVTGLPVLLAIAGTLVARRRARLGR